jgi:hypothetical protein
MRLSVQKAAHANLADAARRKSGSHQRTWDEKDGRSPFQRYCYADKKTVAESKNPRAWSESIGKNRIRPMYAGANMGHPRSPTGHPGATFFNTELVPAMLSTSGALDFVTGTTIRVDGGYAIR